jgi:hypothetical protein
LSNHWKVKTKGKEMSEPWTLWKNLSRQSRDDSDECEKLNGDENCYFPPDIHWRKPRYYLAPSNAGLHGDQYMQIHLQQSRCDGLSGNQLFATGAMLVGAGFMMLMSRPHEPARRPFDYAASPPIRTAGAPAKNGLQAMAAFAGGGSAADTSNTVPLGADISQQSLLTIPQHA